jgi:hypothetical protein
MGGTDMNKVIILSVDAVINPTTKELFTDVANVLKRCHDNGDEILIIGHSDDKLQRASSYFDYAYTSKRDRIRNLIKTVGDDKCFLVIGCHDVDAQVAFNSKILLLCPLWTTIQEKKPLQYGIHIANANQLEKFIKTFKNQSSWYFELDIDADTKVLSLMNAKTKTGDYEQDESAMVESFQDYLKKGHRRNYEVLLYHFISGISNNDEFRKINNWGIFPSSGIDLNNELNDFKEKARTLMFSRGTEPIFIRHTATYKSHDPNHSKDRLPCDRHFETININPFYRKKLEGRNICIFDDYLTNGTSFETARNLLRTQKVGKILFVSLGNFRTTYNVQKYDLKGDVFSPNGYAYKLIGRSRINGKVNYNTIDEIEKLYKIFFK